MCPIVGPVRPQSRVTCSDRWVGYRRTVQHCGVRQTSFGQRVVIVIGLAAGLFAIGTWVTRLGSRVRWVAYAPLSHPSHGLAGGMHPWVRLLIWLVLIAAWTVASVALLRRPRSEQPTHGHVD